MTQTAIVLVIRDTGSVLATVTRAGDPASAPAPGDLAGERFPICDDTGATIVEVAADALDSKVVPLVDDLLINPQQCSVRDDAAALILGAAPTVTLQGDGVTVTVAPQVPEDAAVFVQLEHGAGETRRREVRTETILAGGTKVTIPVTLVQPKYDVVTFVAAHLPAVLADKAVT